LKRDDDSKRYYLYNGLGSNLAMDVSQVLFSFLIFHLLKLVVR